MWVHRYRPSVVFYVWIYSPISSPEVHTISTTDFGTLSAKGSFPRIPSPGAVVTGNSNPSSLWVFTRMFRVSLSVFVLLVRS